MKSFGDCVVSQIFLEIFIYIQLLNHIKAGVATQCLKSNKCFRAKQQYYANVCLK